MIHHYRKLAALFTIIMLITPMLQAMDVTSITGDTGTAQSGALTISGGTSGASFDTSTSTITQSINYVAMPLTSATNGQVLIAGMPILHAFSEDSQNIFVGGYAGSLSDTQGNTNSGCGYGALTSIAGGSANSAFGALSLPALTTGQANTSLGNGAGEQLVSGNNNVFIGQSAGSSYNGSETYNITIGAGTQGNAGESNVTRIGAGDVQTACFIDGIYAATVDFNTALPVFVDDQGTLGNFLSSAQFKDNMQDIGNASSAILNLRPISYTMKSDKKKSIQYGLCAEETNAVMPSLVVPDKKGASLAVRYHELPVLLLNELIKSNKRIATLESEMAALTARIAKLEAKK